MAAFRDLTGNRFGRLTVIERAHTVKEKIHWLVVCDCGVVKTVNGESLKAGNSTSCGCRKKEVSGKLNFIHGEGRAGKNTAEYRTWRAVIRRCTYVKGDDYRDYGGRGIKMCERWNEFKNFLEDMGRRPSRKHSLERKNNDGDYEPSNCIWDTTKNQSRNRRTNVWYEYNGRKMVQEDWAVEFGISANMLRHYVKRELFDKIAKRLLRERASTRNPYEHLVAGYELGAQLDVINSKYLRTG